MNTRELLENVVDYVEVSQEVIADLRKKAAVASAKPAFSEDVLKQTAKKLVARNLLSKEAAETLVQSYPENPDQALLSLQRLADEFGKRESDSAPRPLGTPAPLAKQAADAAGGQNKAASDEAWEQSWNTTLS